jgi:DNA-binding winged helix-turn-helix (wHTH) protein/TolB-like protein/Tfp pilus assembly protein PilF
MEFAFGGYVLIPALMRLDQDGQQVSLSVAAFHALVILIEHRDRVVTKRELLDRVWAGTAVEENSLNQCISSLRKTFGDTRKEARFIATVPGAGYRFVMEVTERERTPHAPEADPISAPAVLPRAGLKKRRLGLALALAGSVLFAAVGWNTMSRADTAVLVLPLESFGSADADYVRKGMATEIEAALARTPGLHVAAGVPDAVLDHGDVREIARKVNARVVLRGQVRESGDLLNFTFELVNPETKRILWSDQFGLKREELAAGESRVVSGILKAIEPGRKVPEPRVVNAAAHELYLRGRLIASTRREADLDRGAAFYERALELDRGYADAYTGLADAYGLRAVNGAAPAGVLDKARSAALRAVELDPDSAQAHAALGLVHYADWKWAEARREFERALELNPYYSITHHRMALLDYVFNDYGAAEAELKRAQELNPYVAAHAYTLAEVYIGARKFEDVIRTSEAIRQSAPESGYPHFLEMQAYLGMGKRAEALKEARLAAERDPSPNVVAMVAIGEGRIDEARKVAAEHGADEMTWATVYARCGEKDRMLGVMRKLIDNRDVIVVGMKDDPVYDPYRADPAFRELMARLHLPASE